jgi:large subunit ribosomal protein L23
MGSMESEIIKKPLLTEKSLSDAQDGKYTFIVETKATKKQVAVALKKAFKVDVTQANSRIIKGKRVRVRGTRIERPSGSLKKVTVRLKKDQKISLFDQG